MSGHHSCTFVHNHFRYLNNFLSFNFTLFYFNVSSHIVIENELKKISASPTTAQQFVFGRAGSTGSIPGSSASSAHNTGNYYLLLYTYFRVETFIIASIKNKMTIVKWSF